MPFIPALRRAATPLHRRPDFLIAGAQKAGTTSLHAYLAEHPGIVPARRKELHYFNLYHHRGPGWYRRQFPWRHRSAGRLTFEATPDYLAHPQAAERIRAELGRIRLIFVLRDPVLRAWSAWRMWSGFADRPEKAAKADRRSFNQAISEEMADPEEQAHLPYHYLSMGRYAEHLERWQALFPAADMLILDHAEMDRDLQGILGRICDFLEIGRMSTDTIAVLGQTRHWSSPDRVMTPDDAAAMERLRAYYAPHDRRLVERFGLHLGRPPVASPAHPSGQSPICASSS